MNKIIEEEIKKLNELVESLQNVGMIALATKLQLIANRIESSNSCDGHKYKEMTREEIKDYMFTDLNKRHDVYMLMNNHGDYRKCRYLDTVADGIHIIVTDEFGPCIDNKLYKRIDEVKND